MFPVHPAHRAILPVPWRDLGMDHRMTREKWLSLGLRWAAHPVFEAGTLRTVEAAGTAVVGIPKHGSGHHVLGIASSGEEATVIATMLRLFNPN